MARLLIALHLAMLENNNSCNSYNERHENVIKEPQCHEIETGVSKITLR